MSDEHRGDRRRLVGGLEIRQREGRRRVRLVLPAAFGAHLAQCALDRVLDVEPVQRRHAGRRHVGNATAELGLVQLALDDIVGQRPAGVTHDIVPLAFGRRLDLCRPCVEPLLSGRSLQLRQHRAWQRRQAGKIVTVDEQIRLAVGAHRSRRDHHLALGQEVDALAERGRFQFAGIRVVEVLAAAGRQHRRRLLRVDAVKRFDCLETVGMAVPIDIDNDKSIDLAGAAARRRRSAIASTSAVTWSGSLDDPGSPLSERFVQFFVSAALVAGLTGRTVKPWSA